MQTIYRLPLVVAAALAAMLTSIAGAPGLARAANITITVSTPSTPVCTTGWVAVKVTSVYQLVSLTATYGTQTVALQPMSVPGNYNGQLSFAAAPYGALSVAIQAVDIYGEVANATQPWFKDCPPTLETVLPVPWTVVRQAPLQLHMICRDDGPDPCLTTVAMYALASTPVLATDAPSPLVLSHPMTGVFHGEATLSYVAKAGVLSTYGQVPFVYEPSPHLVEVESGPGKILDATATHTLWANESVLTLRERSSGQAQTFDLGTTAYGVSARAAAAYITSTGVIVFVNGWAVLEWKNGTATTLATSWPLHAAEYLRRYVAGDYVIYDSGSNGAWIRRHLPSGSEVTLAGEAMAVGPGGEVCLSKGSSGLYRYDGGITTLVTSTPDSGYDSACQIEGSRIVFAEAYSAAKGSCLTLADGATRVDLACCKLPCNNFGAHFVPGKYQLRSGWIAFSRPDAVNNAQVWVRSPAGQETQASFFGTPSTVAGLGDTGEVVFSSHSPGWIAQTLKSLFRPATAGPPSEISSDTARPFWLTGALHVASGRTLFEVGTSLPATDGGSGVADSGSGVADSGSGVADSGSGIADSGSGIADSGSGIADSGSSIADSGSSDGGGRRDAGAVVDAPAADVRAPDGGPYDVEPRDVRPSDVSASDVAAPDRQVSSDLPGVLCDGPVVPGDSGRPDSVRDGSSPRPGDGGDQGCGCGTTPGPADGWGLALLLLALIGIPRPARKR